MTWLWGLVAQAAPEPESWIDLLDRGGLVAGLILALWAFMTRRIITRGTFEEMKEDRDQWRSLALGGKHIAEKAVDVVKEKG